MSCPLSQTVLAKALFDNTAESPEELAFRKGDILMVLEREQGGGPGWWLCSLHGRQGIAPANRLRLLQTAPPPGSDPCRGPVEDSVYLSPVPPLARTAVSSSAEDIDGVYRSPPSVGEGRGAASRPGELRRVEVGRPRSHSSSGTRPRPDWDLGVAGRPRSPSLRGRGTEMTGTLYQTPVSPMPSAAQHNRQPGALMASESVYLAPTGVPRAADEPEDTTYLVPRETLTTGHSEDCYLVPKGTPLAGDSVYQSPTGGVVGTAVCSNGPSGTLGTPQSKVSQDTPGMYQTPTPVGASLHRTSATALAHQHPSQLSPVQASPRPLLKGVSPNPAVARGKPGLACHRGSPLLIRAGQVRVPGSPNFTRKPRPPAPPVRGVTRKDAAPSSADSNSVPKPTAQVTSASLQQEEDKQRGLPPSMEERINNGLEKSNNMLNKKEGNRDYSDAVDDQVQYVMATSTTTPLKLLFCNSYSNCSKNVFCLWEVVSGVRLHVVRVSLARLKNIYKFWSTKTCNHNSVLCFCCLGRCMIPLPEAGGIVLSHLPLVMMMMASMTPLAVSHHKLILRQR